MEKRRKEGMNHRSQRGGQDNPAVKGKKHDCKGCGGCGEKK